MTELEYESALVEWEASLASVRTRMEAAYNEALTIVVGFGLLSSTFLTLVLIPALYEYFAPKLAAEDRTC